jgi:hypothetical protein
MSDILTDCATRDACEWENLESIFHPTAYIYTTWTGRTHYADFLKMSQLGMDKGAFIMHRIHGTTTDINAEATRAVTKMKATISQRFELKTVDDKTCEADAESDCRFCFFFSRNEKNEWKAQYTRHWYEKDKLIPVNPNLVPALDEARLQRYPVGYRYLAYCQEATMGVKVALDLPGHRRDGDSVCGKNHDQLYLQSKDWVEGKEIDF